MNRLRIWASAAVFSAPVTLAASEDGVEAVVLHPFRSSLSLQERTVGSSPGGAVGKFWSGTQALGMRSDQLLESWKLPSKIQPQKIVSRSFSLLANDRIQSVRYGFEVDGYPLCQFELKVHEALDGAMAVLGEVPRMTVNRDFSDADWASEDVIHQIVRETLAVKGLSPEFTIDYQRPCLWNIKGELEPVYEMEIVSGQVLYSLVINAEQIYSFVQKQLHASAETLIFPNNNLDKVRQTYTVPGMKEDGTLQNDYFITCLPTSSSQAECPTYDGNSNISIQQVKEETKIFSYDPVRDYSKFAQTSIFTNVNRTLSWLQEIGYNNFGTRQIRLAVHPSPTDNAVYEPRNSYSMISIGDGGGGRLQNLATDADVVSHELGHHVVYNSIKKIDGESLVLHEGLADFITFARTGNACLGESVCLDTPAGRLQCAVAAQCLRSAENNYSLTGDDLPSDPHRRSQLISGMLWDLAKKDEIPMPELASLVLKSIDLMVINSGYQHFVISLLLSDHANFGGKFCEKIRARSAARGFSAFIEDVTCEKIQAEPVGRNVEGYVGSVAEVTSSKTRARDKIACGVLGGSTPGGHDMVQLIVLLMPLMMIFSRRLRK